MNLKELSVEQLKALAYDNLVLIENCQKTLQMINMEIQSRSKEA